MRDEVDLPHIEAFAGNQVERQTVMRAADRAVGNSSAVDRESGVRAVIAKAVENTSDPAEEEGAGAVDHLCKNTILGHCIELCRENPACVGAVFVHQTIISQFFLPGSLCWSVGPYSDIELEHPVKVGLMLFQV